MAAVPDAQSVGLVIPRLVGGLGNQLFMLANALAYATRTRRAVLIDSAQTLSPGCASRNTYWTTPLMQRFRCLCVDAATETGGAIMRAALTNHVCYNETSFSVAAEIPAFEDYGAVVVSGYFQAVVYVQPIDHILVDCFSVECVDSGIAPRIAEDILQQTGANLMTDSFVSMHVRRGDYAALSHIYVSLDYDYYAAALSHFDENLLVLVFTDNVDAVRQNLLTQFPRRQFVIVPDSVSDVDCFFAMQMCRAGHIVANSTFSWWAVYVAWLRSCKTRCVVTPRSWFARDCNLSAAGLFVDGWLIEPSI